MANCATEPADAESALAELDVLAALDEAALAEDDVAVLAELPDALLAEDDACDDPQAHRPSANADANTVAANSLLLIAWFPSLVVTYLLLR